jgi:hypothetical protein
MTASGVGAPPGEESVTTGQGTASSLALKWRVSPARPPPKRRRFWPHRALDCLRRLPGDVTHCRPPSEASGPTGSTLAGPGTIGLGLRLAAARFSRARPGKVWVAVGRGCSRAGEVAPPPSGGHELSTCTDTPCTRVGARRALVRRARRVQAAGRLTAVTARRARSPTSAGHSARPRPHGHDYHPSIVLNRSLLWQGAILCSFC